MGVDTKGMLAKGTTVEAIKKKLDLKYNNVVVSSHSKGFYSVNFIVGKKEQRSLSVFTNNGAKADYGISGTLVSLGCSGSSVEVIRYLLECFGGYIKENDCRDDFEPVNIKQYEKGKDFTEMDRMRGEIITKLGYTNLDVSIELFEKYKEIILTT